MTVLPDRDPLYSRINYGLTVIASYPPEPPEWYEALAALGPHPSDKERLAVYQSMFHNDKLPKGIGFFLIARHVHVMTAKEESEALNDLGDQLDAIRKAHGLAEDEDWLPEEAPAEYQRLERQFEDLTYELYAQKLEQVGEHWMASVLRWDRKTFERFWDSGRRRLVVPKAADGPKVSEEQLKGVIRNETPDADAREILRLVHTFAAWEEAYDRLLAEEDQAIATNQAALR